MKMANVGCVIYTLESRYVFDVINRIFTHLKKILIAYCFLL